MLEDESTLSHSWKPATSKSEADDRCLEHGESIVKPADRNISHPVLMETLNEKQSLKYVSIRSLLSSSQSLPKIQYNKSAREKLKKHNKNHPFPISR